MAQPNKKITVSVLVPFVVVMLFFSIMIWKKYRTSYETPNTPVPIQAEGRRTVTLFFAAGGTELAREFRDIDPCDDDSSCLKDILDELLNGPVGEYTTTIPEGTAVEAVRLEGSLATIDFNRSFSELLSGSSAEMLAVYSVVNTVTTNFSHIQKVKINIEGNTAVSLPHLDLSEPLTPEYSLELTVAPTAEKAVSGSTTHRKGGTP
jgi:spore germination protein GerM